jgi:hypothetical protein
MRSPLLAVLAADATVAGRRDRALVALLLWAAGPNAETGFGVNSCKSAFLVPPGPGHVFATA